MAALNSSTPQTGSIRLRTFEPQRHDESNPDAVRSRRLPLSNLSVNSRVERVFFYRSEKHAKSTALKLESTSSSEASQMQNPEGGGSKQQASFASCPKSTLLISIEQKQKERIRGRKTPGQFSETSSTLTSAKDASGIIFMALSNKKKIHDMNDELCSLPHVEDIDIQFNRPETLLLAAKPINESIFPYPRVKKLPRSGVDISPYDDHENEKNDTDHKASNAPNQSFFQQLMEIFSYNDKAISMLEYNASSFMPDINQTSPTRTSLCRVIPPGVITHYLADNNKCLSLTSEGQRCKVRHVTSLTLAQLQNMLYFNTKLCMPKIKQLVHLSFCHLHRKAASKEIKTWENELREFSNMQDLRLVFLPQNQRLKTLVLWISLLHLSANTERFQHSVPLSVEPTDIPPKFINPIQQLKPYKPGRLTGSVSEELAKLVIKPLNKTEVQKRGSIYIFWQQPNFRYLKIGRSKDTDKRLKEWGTQCKKDMMVYYPDRSKETSESSPDQRKLSHIARVEELIHLELMNYRRFEPRCPGCDKKHIEWFEVSKEHALRVVRKWSVWMETLPYVKSIKNGEEEWILRDQEKARINQLCEPEQSSHPFDAMPGKAGRVSRRSRYSLRSKRPNGQDLGDEPSEKT
ncbi:hypothetical protein N7540_000134 [Penicillium herquei]|nr:hypothetical protein N7540_000134 [Penicillium herquei]